MQKGLKHETKDISEWVHPDSGERFTFCDYCLKSVVGACAECGSVLSKFDPIGVNKEGKRICYKCSAVHDMEEDA